MVSNFLQCDRPSSSLKDMAILSIWIFLFGWLASLFGFVGVYFGGVGEGGRFVFVYLFLICCIFC